MKRQFATMVASTAILGVTTVFATNPFSDVTPDSWAYQAVSQLAAAGIVNGYPDGTFKGQKDITRFEMAQMIAKAMANQDRANAEQQAMINRLADEFSNELNNLGVRVGRLEDRAGNVKVNGDVRLRYLGTKAMGQDFIRSDGEYSKKSQFEARARIKFNAKINNHTDAVVRMTVKKYELGDTIDLGTTEPSDTAFIDQAYVNHRFGNHVSAKLGRFNQVIGNGYFYDDAFDGAQINIGNEKVQWQAAYGYFLKGGFINSSTEDNDTVTYTSLRGQLHKHMNVGGFFARMNAIENRGFSFRTFYGFHTDMNFDKVWIGGEWVKAAHTEHGTGWTAGVGYGAYDQAKKGTWDVKAQYFNLDEHMGAISSKWNLAYDATQSKNDGHPWFHGYKGWLGTVDYALQDNLGLSVYTGFKGKTKPIYAYEYRSLSNYYRVELNYQF